MKEFIIIGAGPAGLQLAYFLEKSGYDYIVLEKSPTVGSFFKKYPRHRKLISINKVYTGHSDHEINLRWDWNSLLCDDKDFGLPNYTEDYLPHADYLVKYFEDFAEKYNLKIEYNKEVVNVSKKDGVFHISTADGKTFTTRRLIIGTGMFKPNIPEIPGIEFCQNYVDCSVDLEDYKNKRVLILGKANSGFELADHLIGITSLLHVVSPNSIRFAWDTHFVGDLRAVNNAFLDTYQLKSQNAVIDASISKIEKRDGKLHVDFDYAHANGETQTIIYDKVIVATGFRFDSSIFADNIKPELAIDNRLPKQTEIWESTNIKELFFIGTLTQQRDYKKATSSFIHGFRYNAECLFKILEYKYFQKSIPKTPVIVSANDFTEALLKRINRASSLWQQFGFLCDILTLNAEDNQAFYYETLPTDYVRSSPQWQKAHLFILDMEFGKLGKHERTFSISRVRRDEVSNAEKSIFLHPIVRHYHCGNLLSEHHIIESLEADYEDHELHVKPLKMFLKNELEKIQSNYLKKVDNIM